MGTRGTRMAALILCTWLVPPVAAAEEAVHPICPLILHQEREDHEALELAVDLAVTRLAAAESIFGLVDQLWKKDAVERIIYLAARYERDVAGIEVKRQRLLMKRQDAEARQFEAVCSPPGSGEDAAGGRARLDEARRQYLQLDCQRLGEELAIAEVELAYRSEVLASVRDLREHDGAAEQDVIRAERDVEMARKRVNHHERRVRECGDSGTAGGDRQSE